MVKKDKGYQIFANIVMILLCVLAVLPFVLLFMSSVTDEQTLITDGYSFFPKKFSLYAYRYLFTRTSSVVRGYILSIIVTAIGTVLNLLITVLYAYPLSRKQLPGRNFFAFYPFTKHTR